MSMQTELSGIHRKVAGTLQWELFEEVISEYPFPPYTVDIYLPAYHAAVEVDGPHHSRPRDKRRDQFLLDIYALPVYRIGYKQLKDDVWQGGYEEFLVRWEPTIEERMKAYAERVDNGEFV